MARQRNAQRVPALDPFALAALARHIEVLDQEAKDLGTDYEDHGLLFCRETGKPLAY